MHRQATDLHTLASRVGKGDRAAASVLRDRFERQLVFIVRRTMRHGGGSSPLAQRIVAEARRLAPAGWATETVDQEHLANQVARRICDSVLDRLQPAPAVTWTARDTICN